MQSIVLSNLIADDKTSVMLGAIKNQFHAFDAFISYRVYNINKHDCLFFVKDCNIANCYFLPKRVFNRNKCVLLKGSFSFPFTINIIFLKCCIPQINKILLVTLIFKKKLNIAKQTNYYKRYIEGYSEIKKINILKEHIISFK